MNVVHIQNSKGCRNLSVKKIIFPVRDFFENLSWSRKAH